MQSDTIMSSRLQNSITVKKQELDRNRPFPSAVVKKLEEEFLLEWTYNSNAIEGNTLSLRETELVMNHGLTIGGKSLREHFEGINHAGAIKYLESFIEKKTDLSDDFIRGLHRRILHNIDELEAGMYRRHNVRIMTTDFTVRIVPGANHLFQLVSHPVTTMRELRTQYAAGTAAIDPQVLTIMADWIKERSRAVQISGAVCYHPCKQYSA